MKGIKLVNELEQIQSFLTLPSDFVFGLMQLQGEV